MPIKTFSYSLLIPTRNRWSTALAAIASGLACQYPHLQIVVSDNSDDDRLHKELKQRGWLDKVTYHKTETVLSMRDNWERAIEHASGDFISVIGDDDAILPEAPHYANVFFSRHDYEVLNSATAIYKWPSYPFPGRHHYLRIDLDTRILHFHNPREVLRAALAYRTPMGTGPGLYYGFVRRDFLERLKQLRGRWLVDHIPDFDSGYATLMYARSFASIRRPLFVQGHSGRSNSGAMRSAPLLADRVRAFARETNVRAASVLLEAVPEIGTNASTIVSSQFRALEEIRRVLNDPKIDVDRVGAWNYLAKSVRDTYDVSFFETMQAGLRRLAELWGIADKVKLSQKPGSTRGLWYEQGPKKSQTSTGNNQPNTLQPQRLIINGQQAGLRDILDAVNYVRALFPALGASRDPEVRAYHDQWQAWRHEPAMDAARSALSRGDYDEALSQVMVVAREDGSNAEAYRLLGEIHLQRGEWEPASVALARAFSVAPEPATVELYARALLELDLADHAAAVIEHALEQNKNAAARRKLRRVLAEVRRRQEGAHEQERDKREPQEAENPA